jgi:hypothetical protein
MNRSVTTHVILLTEVEFENMREWHKLAAQYPDREFQSRFKQLFPLSSLLRSGIWTSSLKIEEDWEHAVVLTPEGDEVLSCPEMEEAAFSIAEKKFLLVRTLFHNGLLVDVQRTDIRTVELLSEKKLLNHEVLIPWMFDRVLYDRAFDLNVGSRNENLTPAQTTELLRETSPGVFQIGSAVLGPFGICPSAQGRDFPILREVVLGHCADPNCSAIHVSRLTSSESPLLDGVSLVGRSLKRSPTLQSPWARMFVELTLPPHFYYDDYWPGDIVWFLGNAFSHQELQDLLHRVLSLFGRACFINSASA